MTVIFRLLAAFMIGVGLVSCGGPAAPGDGAGGSGPEGVIVGTLADAGGAPLVGAQVSLALAVPVSAARVGEAGVTASGAAVTMTNSRGEFAFDVAQEGMYVLTNLGDTTGALARVVVTRGADGRLSTEGSVAMTALELGAVTGKVADKGAGVMVFLSGTSFLALTAADGSFVIGRVPAGSYEAVAGIAGAVGAAVPVTVTAGAAVALSEDLRLGPVVTGVTPEGLEPIEWELPAWALVSPSEFVIHGSGFGERQGLSRLTYLGFEVPVVAIRSWADDEIVVDTYGLGDPFEVSYKRAYEVEDLRFTLATIAGEAVTPVSAAYGIGADVHGSGVPVPVSFSFGVWPDLLVQGVQVAVAVQNGVAQDSEGGPIAQVASGDARYWEWDAPPAFYVEPVGLLPTIVNLDPTLDPAVARGEPYRLMVRRGMFDMDDDTFVVGPNELSGRLLASDGDTPMPDDGRFSLRVHLNTGWGCHYTADLLVELPLTVEADGTWGATVTVPEGYSGGVLCVGAFYDGVMFDARELDDAEYGGWDT